MSERALTAFYGRGASVLVSRRNRARPTEIFSSRFLNIAKPFYLVEQFISWLRERDGRNCFASEDDLNIRLGQTPPPLDHKDGLGGETGGDR